MSKDNGNTEQPIIVKFNSVIVKSMQSLTKEEALKKTEQSVSYFKNRQAVVRINQKFMSCESL